MVGVKWRIANLWRIRKEKTKGEKNNYLKLEKKPKQSKILLIRCDDGSLQPSSLQIANNRLVFRIE